MSLEDEIDRIFLFELGSHPAYQKAFAEGRNLQRQDFNGDDAVGECIQLLFAYTRGLREAVLAIARKLDQADT
ncbi:MAG: hypothetical protein WCC64_04825 [Aliidongia sp.]